MKHQYAIVGVGESRRSRASGQSTLRMALDASRAALADAGLDAGDLGAVLSYQDMDACTSHEVAAQLSAGTVICSEMLGGGTCTETLVAHAMGLMELGLCESALIFRSLNGRSAVRMGGGDGWGPADWMSILPGGSFMVPFGMFAAGQRVAPLAARHLYETGLTEAALAAVCVTFYEHAQRNPKAILHGRPLTAEDYYASPLISSPFRLHDYCVETDEANALVLTTAARAAELRAPSVHVEAVIPKRGVETAFQYALPDITRVAGEDVAGPLYASAGVSPADIDVAAFYDCFSWVVVRQLEAFGFTEPGETGPFVEKGALSLDGELPSNTAGGMLAEGYTHGMNNVLEMVRQLRGDHRGTDRHVAGARVGLVTGWGGPGYASGMILRGGGG